MAECGQILAQSWDTKWRSFTPTYLAQVRHRWGVRRVEEGRLTGELAKHGIRVNSVCPGVINTPMTRDWYDRANHSEVVKIFSNAAQPITESYRPAKFIAVAKDVVSGTPDLDRAGTSHVERKNGTLRQWCKRLTRLTYAFSKKWDNLQAALALHFAHYNFCRIHGSLRITPAMAAGITDHVWSLGELIG